MTDFAAAWRRAGRALPDLPRGLALAWGAAPRWTALWLVLLVAQGVLPAWTVMLTRPLVDTLAAAFGPDPSALQRAAWLLAAMGGLMVLGEALNSAAGYVRTVQAEHVRDHVSARLQAQSMALDLAFYDTPAYFDHLHRARREANYRPIALLESTGSVLRSGITLVAMARVLAGYGWWLPLALIASTLPAGYVVLRATVRAHDWRRRTTEDERRTWYFEWLMTSRDTAAEMRLFGLGPTFQARFQALRRRLRGERLALARDQGRAELVAGGIALTVIAVTMAWMVWRAARGGATLGDVALFYAALNQGQGLARSLLENIGQLLSNSLFLSDLFEFLALAPAPAIPPAGEAAAPLPAAGAIGAATTVPAVPPAVGTAPAAAAAPPAIGAAPTIRFEAVTFTYPNAPHPVFEGLDLEIPGGRTTAIVGTNGAGKTTLIKLICRFYDPQAGRITFDGVDIRSLPLDDLRRRIAVLFQAPIAFNATAREAIALGDVGVAHPDAAIEAAAEAAGAADIVARLPQGYATPLGVHFGGGVDLSVGEWQRLALARACLRPAPVLVLDEPTSAMDPWAEADWMARFGTLTAGRTVVVITHRIGTARHADIIHVADGGRIVESGSHADLVAAGARTRGCGRTGRREPARRAPALPPSPCSPFATWTGRGRV